MCVPILDKKLEGVLVVGEVPVHLQSTAEVPLVMSPGVCSAFPCRVIEMTLQGKWSKKITGSWTFEVHKAALM